MKNALDICKPHAEAAKERKAMLRAQFPLCAEIVEWVKAAGFEGFRVVKMQEDGRTWSR